MDQQIVSKIKELDELARIAAEHDSDLSSE
jgi:hypothetical protein